jgi:ribonuclease-3
MQPYIDEALANEHQSNFKSLLQQYAQRQWGSTPEYHLLDEKGPDHSRCFEIGVSIGGKHFPTAWGMNKKEAEQEAARLALEHLGILPTTPEDP